MRKTAGLAKSPLLMFSRRSGIAEDATQVWGICVFGIYFGEALAAYVILSDSFENYFFIF